MNITETAVAADTDLVTLSTQPMSFCFLFLFFLCSRSAATPAPHPAQSVSASAAPPALLSVSPKSFPPTPPPTSDGLRVISPKGVDGPPSPSDRAAFWNSRLAATRPEKIQVQIRHARLRTY